MSVSRCVYIVGNENTMLIHLLRPTPLTLPLTRTCEQMTLTRLQERVLHRQSFIHRQRKINAVSNVERAPVKG